MVMATAFRSEISAVIVPYAVSPVRIELVIGFFKRTLMRWVEFADSAELSDDVLAGFEFGLPHAATAVPRARRVRAILILLCLSGENKERGAGKYLRRRSPASRKMSNSFDAVRRRDR